MVGKLGVKPNYLLSQSSALSLGYLPHTIIISDSLVLVKLFLKQNPTLLAQDSRKKIFHFFANPRRQLLSLLRQQKYLRLLLELREFYLVKLRA
jgi:hypothetical protein